MNYTNKYNQPIGKPLNDFKPCQKPSSKMLDGNYCCLEKINANKHSEDLFNECNNDEKAWTYVHENQFQNLNSFKNYIKECEKSTDPYTYAIIDKKTNKTVGRIAYMRIKENIGSIEIGRVLFSKKMRKSCIGTEAVYLLLCEVFEKLKYRRCEWKCDSLNEASRNAAIRYGFTYEGTFRNAMVQKGRSRDTAWYSIIDSEWQILKSAFECWLSEDNFTDDEKQIKSLSTFMNKI